MVRAAPRRRSDSSRSAPRCARLTVTRRCSEAIFVPLDDVVVPPPLEVDPTLRDRDGRTPLMLAVLGGHARAVALLSSPVALTHHPHVPSCLRRPRAPRDAVDARDHNGRTALAHAASEACAESVEVGSRVWQSDAYGVGAFTTTEQPSKHRRRSTFAMAWWHIRNGRLNHYRVTARRCSRTRPCARSSRRAATCNSPTRRATRRSTTRRARATS